MSLMMFSQVEDLMLPPALSNWNVAVHHASMSDSWRRSGCSWRCAVGRE